MRATITSKGQVTIPAEVRQGLGVEAGDVINFVMLDERTARIYKVQDLDDLFDCLGPPPRPLDEKEFDTPYRRLRFD